MTNPFDSTPALGQTIRLVEFAENDDLIVRVFSPRGSFPVVLRENGEDKSDAEIGAQLRSGADYYLRRETTAPVITTS